MRRYTEVGVAWSRTRSHDHDRGLSRGAFWRLAVFDSFPRRAQETIDPLAHLNPLPAPAMTQLRSILLIPLVVSAACSDASQPTETLRSEARDSAGISIVENQAPAADSRMAWQISAEPTLSIGTLDGDAAYQLFRVQTATKLADGRLLIANSGTSEIRVFDPSGAFIEAWGREGEGPGEFTGLGDVGVWPGDSVMAWDFRQRRISVFDAAGRHGRTFLFAQNDDVRIATYLGLLPDGSVFVMASAVFGSGPAAEGLTRPDRGYARMGREGELVANLGPHPGTEAYMRTGENFVTVMRHPFGRTSVPAIWHDMILISPNDTYEIKGYDPSGTLKRIVRREHALREVSQSHVDAWVDERLAGAALDQITLMTQNYEDFPTVESFPAFSDLRVDARGYLWVEEFSMPDDGRRVWTVFDPDGRVEGFIETPIGLEVYEIGDDYLLGRVRDDFDVEFVQMWGLSRIDG